MFTLPAAWLITIKSGFDCAVCYYAEKMSVALFGANQAHLGYALFLIFNGLILLGFALLTYPQPHHLNRMPNGIP